jgi:LacI family transcriptional regulator
MDRVPRSGPASIKDVARLAGVSFTTVSHCLNGTRYVSPERRARVEAAVAALDYRHNSLARGLRTRQSGAIGLIIPDVTNPFNAQVARGVQDALDAQGYAVFLCNSDRQPAQELRLLRALDRRQADGVVLDSVGATAPLLEELRRRRRPIVLLGSRLDHPAFDRVLVAPRGAYVAVRHLLERGHRRIALIGGPPAAGEAWPTKAGGYLAALREAGGEPPPSYLEWGEYTRQSGHAAALRLLDLPEPPTAIFAANDLMAIGALRALRERARRVPQDVAVAGYDDVPEAAMTIPALTTIAVPAREMGHAAAELLLDRVRGGHAVPARRLELPYRLVVREST